MTTSTYTATDRKYTIDGTREEELQATVDAIDRYRDKIAGLSWFEFGEKQLYRMNVKRAKDHLIHILKRYKEGERIR
jgi:flavin-binding protein dodecin